MFNSPVHSFAVQYNLTPRETDLLQAVVEYGYTNEQIAELLQIQKKTVNIHMTNLLAKTGCASSRVLLSKIIAYLLTGNRKDEIAGEIAELSNDLEVSRMTHNLE